MHLYRTALAAIALSSVAVATAAFAQAKGAPQRNPEPPRGLLATFGRGVPGLTRAIMATEGSNSRLQDLPASP